jgi:ABC-type transport system involved in multi-copper enzyme maturation permease subunit
MYYWKIWRETRVVLFALLIVGVGVGWAAWSQINLILGAGFDVGQALPAELASRVWGRGAEQVLIFGGVTLYFIGLLLGASGLGEEIERGTAVFLLTRPRSRGYFVWSFFLACALELFAFTLITVLAGYATLFYLTRRVGPWNVLFIGPIIMITGLLAVGVAHLLTIGSRRSKNAVAGGLAFTLTYLALAFVCAVLRQRHIVHIVLPTPLSMYSLDWNAALTGAIMYGVGWNALGTMLGWLVTAVAFIAVAHLIVTRMEV